MATEANVIDQVRRRISDFAGDRRYGDEYYQDAIGFALGKLNTDYGTTYAAASAVPTNSVFLLVKLATIEMCYIRATEVMDTDEDTTSADDFGSITVPDLSVSSSDSSESQSANVWLDLAGKLQNEYDGELEHSGGTSQVAEVQVGILRRISTKTGGWTSYKLDEGLAAVTAAVAVSGTTATLTWSTLYDETFNSYQIYRDTSLDMANEERVAVIVDNHTVEYDDENLSPGTYYYSVKTVNPSDLKTDSNIVSAVVT